MTAHPIQWHAPKPLWARFGATPQDAATAADQHRPAILRFATDDFMDQVIGTLGRDPHRLGDFLARPETWRTPAAPSPDLTERVVVPTQMRHATRTRALARPASRLEPVPATASAIVKSQARALPLKLYQAGHLRHYLVSASLVCGVAGLPERALTAGGSEQVNFVLRRLLPLNASSSGDSSPREFAFVKDAEGARWQLIATGEDAAHLAPGEELLPLFPLTYRDELGHLRTLWTGVVPVGRREEYFGAAVDRTPVAMADGQRQALQSPPTASSPSGITARMTQFKLDIAEPWKNLVRSAYTAQASLDAAPANGLSGSEPAGDKTARVLTLNLQWQQQSWIILLDFADYLAAYLPGLWAVIAGTAEAGPLTPQQQKLLDWLDTATMSNDLTMAMQTVGLNKPAWTSLRDALKNIGVWRTGLEQATQLYGTASATAQDNPWPDRHFLLVGIDATRSIAGAFTAVKSLPAPTNDDEVFKDRPPVTPDPGQDAEMLDRLTALVVRALDVRPETDVPPQPFALKLRDALAATVGDAGTFVMRCVYLNRDCGPLHPPTVSAPTQRFQLASFFDSDAPARPVRITLPLDTTPSGLRRHAKNTAFIISDTLCGQIQRAKGLGLGDLVRSVLPWPFHKDLDAGGGDTGPCQNDGGINIGMICSLSIPIITICALIVLFVFVLLFDLVFRWLPFFALCFPVPKFKAKNGGSA